MNDNGFLKSCLIPDFKKRPPTPQKNNNFWWFRETESDVAVILHLKFPPHGFHRTWTLTHWYDSPHDGTLCILREGHRARERLLYDLQGRLYLLSLWGKLCQRMTMSAVPAWPSMSTAYPWCMRPQPVRSAVRTCSRYSLPYLWNLMLLASIQLVAKWQIAPQT